VGGVRFTSSEWLKTSEVLHPSENILLGDKVPYGNPPVWSSALWWPTASMTGPVHEGVVPRHANRGVVLFNDGHPELRTDSRINPPVDPTTGSSKALKNAYFWDPLQRNK
jgi:hypothetical protein